MLVTAQTSTPASVGSGGVERNKRCICKQSAKKEQDGKMMATAEIRPISIYENIGLLSI